MKSALLFLIVCCSCLGNEPDLSKFKLEPLPFPKPTSDFQCLSIEAVDEVQTRLKPKIGEWPPNFESPDDRQHTYSEWSQAVLSIEQIYAEEGLTERVAILLLSVYLEGHNMEVADCGEKAHPILGNGLKKFTDSIPFNLQAARFLLQTDRSNARLGEAVLMRLRKLVGTKDHPEVERLMVFAYLYQNKTKQTKEQLDRCLRMNPKDQQLLLLKKALKNGTYRVVGS